MLVTLQLIGVILCKILLFWLQDLHLFSFSLKCFLFLVILKSGLCEVTSNELALYVL
jgi:hypothetical protein